MEKIAESLLCKGVKVAVVGASPKRDRTSHEIMSYLSGNGMRSIPVNPSHAGEIIQGEKCLSSVSELPEDVKIIDMVVSPKHQDKIIEELRKLTFRPLIWFQPGAENEKAEKELESEGFSVVSHACIMVVHSLYCTEDE